MILQLSTRESKWGNQARGEQQRFQPTSNFLRPSSATVFVDADLLGNQRRKAAGQAITLLKQPNLLHQ